MPNYRSGGGGDIGVAPDRAERLSAMVPTRRALKVEPDVDADNTLEQFVAALARIEEGLSDIATMVIAIDEKLRARDEPPAGDPRRV